MPYPPRPAIRSASASADPYVQQTFELAVDRAAWSARECPGGRRSLGDDDRFLGRRPRGVACSLAAPASSPHLRGDAERFAKTAAFGCVG